MEYLKGMKFAIFTKTDLFVTPDPTNRFLSSIWDHIKWQHRQQHLHPMNEQAQTKTTSNTISPSSQHNISGTKQTLYHRTCKVSVATRQGFTDDSHHSHKLSKGKSELICPVLTVHNLDNIICREHPRVDLHFLLWITRHTSQQEKCS